MRIGALALRCEFDYSLSFAALDIYGPLKIGVQFGCVETLSLIRSAREIGCVKLAGLV